MNVRSEIRRRSGSSADTDPPIPSQRPVSTTGNLPVPVNASRQEAVDKASQLPLPPPLPPKPAFARASAIPKPPPLPPKHESARAPRVIGPHQRPNRQSHNGQVVAAEFAARGEAPYVSYGAGLAESSAKSSSHRRLQSLSTKEDTTNLTTSSSSAFLPVAAAEHRRASSVPIPFPPPPCTLRECGMTRLFARGKTDSKDLLSAGQPSSVATGIDKVRVPKSSRAEVEVGAASIEKSRNPVDLDKFFYDDSDEPVRCSQYQGLRQGGEVWAVVDHVVNASDAKSPEWLTAVELLVGMIVSAAIESIETGNGILLEVVRRMKKGSTDIRAGIFTLLLNIGAQASFAGGVWRDVERIALSVFSRVVEEMDVEGIETAWNRGRNLIEPNTTHTDFSEDAAYVWGTAIKCGIALLGGGRRFGDMTHAYVAAYDTHLQWSQSVSLKNSGPAVSLKALVALGKHIQPETHPVVERVIVGEGVWRGFRGSFDEEDDMIRMNVDEDKLYTAHGGVQEIIGLYIGCRSILSRRRLFALILEVAVARVLSRASSTGDSDMSVSEEQVNWLYALLRSNDAGDALVSTFRLGPHPDFVTDVLRHLLFEPLASSGPSASIVGRKRVNALSLADTTALPPRSGAESLLSSPAGYLSQEERCIIAAKEHRDAVVVANRLLHKKFVLGVLMQLESMAKSFSNQYRHNNSRDLLTLSGRVEAKVSEIRLHGRSSSLRTSKQIWLSLHAVIVSELSENEICPREIISVIEKLFSVILRPNPFSSVLTEGADCEPDALLAGERRVLWHTSAESAELLTSLLRVSTKCGNTKYVSDLRQSLVEILGCSTACIHRASEFVDDKDDLVAYRARCIGSFASRP